MSSTEPNKLEIANKKLEELDNASGIQPQVKALLANYQDTSNPTTENPSTMTWDPELNDGQGGFKK